MNHPKEKGTNPFEPSPNDGSITAVHNWHGTGKWEHAVIKDGKAQKISEAQWHELMDQGAPVNQPLYCTEEVE